MAVGFADMVGFTAMSERLSLDDLAGVVDRFEEISLDVVTSEGGRIVKTMGDECMFVADSARAAARIGVRLAEHHTDDAYAADVRIGLACGPVLPADGDYFGPTVNLASRLVGIADPGNVLISAAMRAELDSTAPGEFSFRSAPNRELKGIGEVEMVWCGWAASPHAPSVDVGDLRRRWRWWWSSGGMPSQP